jgi:cell shape-determining protein MreD
MLNLAADSRLDALYYTQRYRMGVAFVVGALGDRLYAVVSPNAVRIAMSFVDAAG